MTKRILITGSRFITQEDVHIVNKALEDEIGDDTDVVIVEGGASGVDHLTYLYALHHDLPYEEHPADWKTYGKAAGPMRNQKMVSLGADVCLAFPAPQSRGTVHCIGIAQVAGIPVKVFPVEGLTHL